MTTFASALDKISMDDVSTNRETFYLYNKSQERNNFISIRKMSSIPSNHVSTQVILYIYTHSHLDHTIYRKLIATINNQQ
jgi:hypothetical protein